MTNRWTPIGPSVMAWPAGGFQPVSGRINDIAVGPGGARVYIAAGNGSVWLLDNSPTAAEPGRWEALDGSASGSESTTLSASALAVRFGASRATDQVVVGTGDALTFLTDPYASVGIKISTQGGAPGTFVAEAPPQLHFYSVVKLAIDPDDPLVIWAASWNGLFLRATGAPPSTWTQDPQLPSAFVPDVAIAGSGGGKTVYTCVAGQGVFRRNTNGTWTNILPLAGQAHLAVAESAPGTVYAFTDQNQLYRLNAGTFYSVANIPPGAIPSFQRDYDIVVAVDPANPDLVYLAGGPVNGGVAFFRGTVSGAPGSYAYSFNPANNGNPSANSTWIGAGVHTDSHGFSFAQQSGTWMHDGSIVWLGTDGGAFALSPSGAYLSQNTGLATSLIPYFAQHPVTDAAVYACAQDNGAPVSFGDQAWPLTDGGDGGGIAVDPNNAYQLMRQSPGGIVTQLNVSVDGAASWNALATFPPSTNATEASNTGIFARVAVSPSGVSPTMVAFGTNRLWYSENWGQSWVTLSQGTNPYAVSPPDLAQDVLDGTAITDIHIASQNLIVACTRKQVWKFVRNGANWSKTQIPTPAPFPQSASVSIDAIRVETAGTGLYVALAGNGFDHVWYYDGANWQTAQLAQNTVDVPFHAIVVDPSNTNNVYAGSNVGVWQGIKSGASWSWSLFSNNLPPCMVSDLAIHDGARLLRASLYGRGVWEVSLGNSDPDVDLYMRANHADSGRLGGSGRFSWVEGGSDPTALNQQAWHWMSADIKVRRASLLNNPPLNSPPDFLDFAFHIGDYLQPSTRMETADTTGPNSIFVEIHNRGPVVVPKANLRVLLLLAPCGAGLPLLPNDYATRIVNGDTSNWPSATNWHFADPGNPYRTPPSDLETHVPQVVEWDGVDFSQLPWAVGYDHICATAFVTTAGSGTLATADQIGFISTSIDQLALVDKHVAQRNLHLVPAGTTPLIHREGQFTPLPTSFLLDVNHAREEERAVELEFARPGFAGHLAVAAAAHVVPRSAPNGWRPPTREEAEAQREHLEEWIERKARATEELRESHPNLWHEGMERLRAFAKSPVLVAEAPSPRLPMTLAPHARATLALTLKAPATARPGDGFRLDILQRDAGRVVGGSTFVIAVIERRR